MEGDLLAPTRKLCSWIITHKGSSRSTVTSIYAHGGVHDEAVASLPLSPSLSLSLSLSLFLSLSLSVSLSLLCERQNRAAVDRDAAL